jgi:hypothetical protein
MPTTYLAILVTKVIAVPTENDVAKAKASVQTFAQFIGLHILAAENTVDVGDGNFNPARLPGLEQLL